MELPNMIKGSLWLDKAQAALAAGDTTQASELLANIKSSSLSIAKSSTLGQKNRTKATFAPGLTTESDLTPFTAYWDDHLWKIDIHIPLTIFDVDWINRDLLVAVKKSSKSKDRPTGQLPKIEWWLSYSDWTRATRLFIQYLKEIYHHDEFADALQKHFNYVIKIDERHDWVTVFGYDIAVRSNVMCHHVNGSVADPSVKRPTFLEEAIAKTDSYKDGWIRRHDKPYVKGGEKERFNPLTGTRYDKLQLHDVNEPEDLPIASTLISTSNRDSNKNRRSRSDFYKRGRRGSTWGNNVES